ncbi:MAG TPA: hypothetical protein VIG33_00185 [Pseudobdellovibrionaceae bacterium]
MMIMMWLSAIAMMIGSLSVFRLGIGQCFGTLQTRFLNLSESVPLFKMLLTTKLCAVGQGSFVQSQYGAVALLNSRSFSKRYSILLLCLSSAGLWTTMMGILLAWQINGEILLSVAVCVYLFYRWTKKGLGFLIILTGLGGFLVGAQWVLQKQSILLSVLGESEFHFLLADGRFPAQLLWLFVTFVLTLVIEIESWATLTALVLLVAGSLSLNGAVAIIIGEILAHVWVLSWRSRKLNQEAKMTAKSYAIASTVGLVIAFFAAGLLRDAFAWNFTFEGNPLTEKSWQFLSFYLLIIIAQTLTVLLWGHFAAQKKLDEVQKGEYFSVRWISRGLVSNKISDFILKKLKERLDLLLNQKKDLDSKERAQIPGAFLKVHEQEIAQLALWLPLAEASQKANRP